MPTRQAPDFEEFSPVMANGFEIPQHTQTPNSFFDETLPQIKSIAELKVMLAIMRMTFGWRKFSDTISMSQLEKLTGLTHQGVANGIALALEHEFVERHPVGQSFSYSLKLVNEIDQSSKLTSQVNRLVKEIDQSDKPLPTKKISPSSQVNRLVKQIDTQKKEEEIHRDELFESLASVCRIDWKLCTVAQRGQLNQTVGVLRKEGHTAQEIQRVGCWWFANDWRGKKGQAPKPSEIREVWLQAFDPMRVIDEHPNAYRPGKMVY
jgi:hypothetical protein